VQVSDGPPWTVRFGAGYVPAEFAATGVEMAGRGGRMDDYIGAMRALWSMDRPEYHGRFVSFSGIDARPRPAQRPCPPIVIGGWAPAALRRAVTTAEGWYGFGLDLAGTRRCVESLREIARAHERPAHLGPLKLSVTPVGPLDRSTVDRYAELGVDRLILQPQPDADRAHPHVPVSADRIMANIDRVAEQIIAD